MSTEREKKVAALAEQVGGTLDDPSARLQDPAMTAGSVATRRTGPMIEEGLPLHRTEAGWPNCATCEGGGCLDCTDPS